MHTSYCFSKINLSLKIINSRSDGYHNLDSNVIFTNISDKISIKILKKQQKKINLEIIGPFSKGLSKNKEHNIVYKATKYFYKYFKIRNNLKIILNKNLPVASGIGGGSADAAAVLTLLPKIFNIKKTKSLERIKKNIALKIGSDIPACMISKPLRMLSKGEKLSNIDIQLKKTIAAYKWIILVTPNKMLSTEKIFLRFSKMNFKTNILLKNYTNNSIGINDLQHIAEKFCPEIIYCKKYLSQQNGIKYIGMSGTGPTCFGIFKNKNQAANAISNIRKLRPKWWIKQGTIIH